MFIRRKNETITRAVNGNKTQEKKKEIKKRERELGQKHNEK